MKDKEIEKLIKEEEKRQKRAVNLIASENYVSKDVLAALGSVLTNKYAEGYPGARYYGGNEVVDEVENLCKERALKTFKLSSKKWSVNVQPLSGSPANLAVYMALVPQGGRIMGMSLTDGGHLTHGQKVSATGKFWEQVSYGVDEKTEVIDYEALKKKAKREKPHLIVAGYTAYPRKVDWKKMREIADSCNAYLMVDMSHLAGLVAGGVYPSPFPYADLVTTTVHKTLRGPRAAIIFARKTDPKRSSRGTEGSREIPRRLGMTHPGKTIAQAIDKAVFPGLQGGPHANQIAATAAALKEAQSADFKKYAKQVVKNAKAFAVEFKKLGWRVVSGGTDSHLLLLDVWMAGDGIGGKEASERLEKEGIIVNKNTIPGETRKPMDPSGIRLGTAAETTRGKKEDDFRKLAQRIDKILRKSI